MPTEIREIPEWLLNSAVGDRQHRHNWPGFIAGAIVALASEYLKLGVEEWREILTPEHVFHAAVIVGGVFTAFWSQALGNRRIR